jgi:hypothetical protein
VDIHESADEWDEAIKQHLDAGANVNVKVKEDNGYDPFAWCS